MAPQSWDLRPFTNPYDLRRKVESALREWRGRHPDFQDAPPPAPVQGDPTAYLRCLREQTAWIDIRGLQLWGSKAHRFPIEDFYIPLTTPGEAQPSRLGLKDSLLAHHRLVIVGDPGSGKTTFLRYVANMYSRQLLDTPSRSLTFPILIRISELAEHIRNCYEKSERPTTDESPSWLIHFLTSRNQEFNWGLNEVFFRDKLKSTSCMVLLTALTKHRPKSNANTSLGCSRRRPKPIVYVASLSLHALWPTRARAC
jgi:hypothetical protein